MDHKDVQIALRTDEWGSGSYDDWRELFINFVRKDNIPQTIEDMKKEIRKFRELVYKITKDEISTNLSGVFMFIKTSMRSYIDGIKNIGVSPVIYSMWDGYLNEPSMKDFIRTLNKGDDRLIYHVHTSGHADVSTLKRVVSRLRPDMVIPIHTLGHQMYKDHFRNVIEISDGQEIEI